MKKTWFYHTQLAADQADELVARYREKGVFAKKSLDADYLSWTVSAKLPEASKAPRQNRMWQQKMWRS